MAMIGDDVKLNEIVKYKNDFNNQELRKFTAEELNLLMTILHKVRDNGTKILNFSFNELKKLIRLEKNMTIKEFSKTIMNVNKKLLALNYTFQSEELIIQFALFQEFVINTKTQNLTIAVSERFKFLLNEFEPGNWTRFELEEFVRLKSSYTKEFYRRMKQFRSTGFWSVNLDEFKRLMDIPVNYRMCDIDVKVLKPIQKELKEKYGLKIQKTYNTKGRGRPAVSGFIFTFLKEEPQSREIKEEKKEIKTPADFFIHRKVRMMDGVTGMFNTLTIKSINEQKNGMVVVKIQNVDDFYEQEFAFNSMEHFENWFRKYVI